MVLLKSKTEAMLLKKGRRIRILQLRLIRFLC